MHAHSISVQAMVAENTKNVQCALVSALQETLKVIQFYRLTATTLIHVILSHSILTC